MYFYLANFVFISGPCGRPEDIPYAKFVGSSFNFNDKLKYTCEDSYTLKGPRRRRCGEDGKWSKAPKCLGLWYFVRD